MFIETGSKACLSSLTWLRTTLSIWYFCFHLPCWDNRKLVSNSDYRNVQNASCFIFTFRKINVFAYFDISIYRHILIVYNDRFHSDIFVHILLLPVLIIFTLCSLLLLTLLLLLIPFSSQLVALHFLVYFRPWWFNEFNWANYKGGGVYITFIIVYAILIACWYLYWAQTLL